MQADPGSPVYFILRLPKTAGSTIEVHLDEHCPTGVLWRPQPAPRWEILRGRRYDFRRLPDMSRVRVVVGHHVGQSLEGYFPGREIRRVVLLRDPLSLQISYYNYMNMWYLEEGSELRVSDFISNHSSATSSPKHFFRAGSKYRGR